MAQAEIEANQPCQGGFSSERHIKVTPAALVHIFVNFNSSSESRLVYHASRAARAPPPVQSPPLCGDDGLPGQGNSPDSPGRRLQLFHVGYLLPVLWAWLRYLHLHLLLQSVHLPAVLWRRE